MITIEYLQYLILIISYFLLYHTKIPTSYFIIFCNRYGGGEIRKMMRSAKAILGMTIYTGRLSFKDARRFHEMGLVFEGKKGRILRENIEGLGVVELPKNGLILERCFFPMVTHTSEKGVGEAFGEHIHREFLEMSRKITSPKLSNYLWPSNEGDHLVEIRSPVRGFPPPGKLTVVNSNEMGQKRGGEYCLAACDDGTVKWLHETECVLHGNNHVWKVHLFDLRVGGDVYLRDRLQRTGTHACNIIIGGNVNNGSGSQTIGSVDCRPF